MLMDKFTPGQIAFAVKYPSGIILSYEIISVEVENNYLIAIETDRKNAEFETFSLLDKDDDFLTIRFSPEVIKLFPSLEAARKYSTRHAKSVLKFDLFEIILMIFTFYVLQLTSRSAIEFVAILTVIYLVIEMVKDSMTAGSGSSRKKIFQRENRKKAGSDAPWESHSYRRSSDVPWEK